MNVYFTLLHAVIKIRVLYDSVTKIVVIIIIIVFVVFISGTLQFALQRSVIVIVCCLSVTRVYCDKATEVRIMRFSRKSRIKS